MCTVSILLIVSYCHVCWEIICCFLTLGDYLIKGAIDHLLQVCPLSSDLVSLLPQFLSGILDVCLCIL